MKHILPLMLCSMVLASCAQPPPPTVIYYAPTQSTPKKTTPKTTTPKPQPTPQREPGRFVDGRFIRDTPPESVEPAKTIRVEKDF